jgi:hypothetical protein
MGHAAMDPALLQLLVTREMPFGKYKAASSPICPATTSRGSRAKAFRRANWAACWP